MSRFLLGHRVCGLAPENPAPFLLSDNAAPFPMLKIDDVAPHKIPGLSRILGPFRTEFFVGQLSGQHWEECTVSSCQSYPGYPGVVGPNISPQPFIHGEKISFQPTRNFEFGMGITAMFGGPGLPVTFGNFFALTMFIRRLWRTILANGSRPPTFPIGYQVLGTG